MILRFHEGFDLPVEEVYGYFRTPADWTRLYGIFGEVKDRGDGWFAVPLKSFPFPLVAKITEDEPMKRVRWIFRGFWRGTGEVRFAERPDGVTVEGYEEIAVRPLGLLSSLVERLLLERRFRAIWAHGWRRLRRGAARQRAAGAS
jgi:uncharacterized membrane protein